MGALVIGAAVDTPDGPGTIVSLHPREWWNTQRARMERTWFARVDVAGDVRFYSAFVLLGAMAARRNLESPGAGEIRSHASPEKPAVTAA